MLYSVSIIILGALLGFLLKNIELGLGIGFVIGLSFYLKVFRD